MSWKKGHFCSKWFLCTMVFLELIKFRYFSWLKLVHFQNFQQLLWILTLVLASGVSPIAASNDSHSALASFQLSFLGTATKHWSMKDRIRLSMRVFLVTIRIYFSHSFNICFYNVQFYNYSPKPLKTKRKKYSFWYFVQKSWWAILIKTFHFLDTAGRLADKHFRFSVESADKPYETYFLIAQTVVPYLQPIGLTTTPSPQQKALRQASAELGAYNGLFSPFIYFSL